MVQTDRMVQLYDAAMKLEEVSTVLFEANLDDASREASRLADVVLEEYNRLQTPVRRKRAPA